MGNLIAATDALGRVTTYAYDALDRLTSVTQPDPTDDGIPPPLLILDEPTNHLDLDSIEAVEVGLRTYDGALLIVSHDETFLAAVGITRWLELPTPPQSV